MAALDKFWNSMIYNVCKGDVVAMREIKRLDVFEFLDYVDKTIEDGRRRTNAKGR